ncbi:MAG TPA: hypothetical protein PK677_09885 [Acidiphilium sp.]|nr:hypothetical protein [Acidiphilium sp.]HQU23750.1 hypothetical protein [Acidiphilium sp.]
MKGKMETSKDWSPEMQAEFSRRRRSRNWALLAFLVGLCLLIYAIAVAKLYYTGRMW